MKERSWWTTAENLTGANIVWTSWNKREYIRKLPQRHYDSDNIPLATYLPNIIHMCNHLEGNSSLGNKKGLFNCLFEYYKNIKEDLYSIIPLTFHICNQNDVVLFKKFIKEYQEKIDSSKSYYNEEKDEDNIWIIKPGENSNRGKGIIITRDLKRIEDLEPTATHTYIIQKYIDKPLLINKRKFDIRCFGLITSINGFIKGYYYQDGYLRTSSKKFTTENLTRAVHLTNEAVQMRYEDFGKFEHGNKVLCNATIDFI